MSAAGLLERIRNCDPIGRMGRVTRVTSNSIEGDGPNIPIGSLCRIGLNDPLLAEVIGIDREVVRFAPYRQVMDIRIGDLIEAVAPGGAVAVGDSLLGRTIDGLGEPLDGLGPIAHTAYTSIELETANAMSRHTPGEPLETGLRAIDGLLPLAKGQRVGILAASGVGKTSLINQLTGQVPADRCVICCIGERGREVEALWTHMRSADAGARTTIVAATSDQAAVMRTRAAKYALALARYWRAQGHHVLLMFDSISRYAMALREIGLSAGEPPTVRAYTPNVFATLPRLVEQGGALRNGGAISAFFTVLSETDDNDDPLVEVMKSLLDGHIILSRDLAERGHFPAIDIARSVSRLAQTVSGSRRLATIARTREQMAIFAEARLLIESGLYSVGSSSRIDRAVELCGRLDSWLRQEETEVVPLIETHRALEKILAA